MEDRWEAERTRGGHGLVQGRGARRATGRVADVLNLQARRRRYVVRAVPTKTNGLEAGSRSEKWWVDARLQ